MTGFRFGIISASADEHDTLVADALASYPDVTSHIFAMDQVCRSGGLTWSGGQHDTSRAVMVDTAGDEVDVHGLDVIWWRPQRCAEERSSVRQVGGDAPSIEHDCSEAVVGVLYNAFKGRWISHPMATMSARNQLIQLNVAMAAGFRVPRTLVSQDPAAIQQFCSESEGHVRVKALHGNEQQLLTPQDCAEQAAADEAWTAAPLLYQHEPIGSTHLRVSCFGNMGRAGTIETDDVHGSVDPSVVLSEYDLPVEFHRRLERILMHMGLRMGVFDLKMGEDGVAVWAQLHPQGRFLSAAGFAGVHLEQPFAEFLYSEAQHVSAWRQTQDQSSS